jgi:hypothetical protein
MDKELKIKVTGDSNDVLKKLSKNLTDAKNEFLLLKQSGTATADALKQAGNHVTQLGTQLRVTKKELNDLANATRGVSKFQLLEFGENLTVVTAGLVAAGTAAVAFGKKIYETAHQGAEFEQLYNHFVKINGGIENSNKLLQDFRIASAGNLSDEELIKYSNTMQSLGYSTKTTTQLLDIAEKRADEVGTTFEQSEAALNKFITTGAKKGLVDLGINIADVNKEMVRMTGFTEKQIATLEDSEQQLIRTDAITSLYGDTLENINKKIKGNDDKIASLSKTYDNFKNILSVGVSSAFVSVADSIGLTTKSFETSLESAKEWGKEIGIQITDTFTYLTQGIRGLKENVDSRREAEINRAFNTPLPIINPDSDIFPLKKDFLENRRDFKLPSGSNTGGNSRTNLKEKEVIITNELIDKKKELADALLKEATFVDKTTLAYANYTAQLAQLRNELAGLNLPMSTLTVNGQVATLPGGVRDNAIPLIPVDPKAKEQSTLLEDSNTLYSNISSAMSVLGVGADTFVGGLLSGFNTVLTIMQAIKSVNTILSFIPGFASGGNFAGGSPIMVGERGPEIIFPNTSGYVMNNFNSMQVMKSQQQPIYINANLNAMEFYKTGKKDFNILQGFKRIN